MAAKNLFQAALEVIASRICGRLLHADDLILFTVLAKRLQLELTQSSVPKFIVLHPLCQYFFQRTFCQSICIDYLIELLNRQVWLVSDSLGPIIEASLPSLKLCKQFSIFFISKFAVNIQIFIL